MDKSKQREVQAIVMPDLAGNPWPVPRGFPVVFDDGRAYFIAALGAKGRAAHLMEKLDEAQAAQRDMQADSAPTSRFIQTMTELTAANLALQYSDETIGRISEDGAISASIFNDVIMCCMGRGPDYEVVARKNG